MGRLVTYIGILSVTLLIFHFAGLIQNTPSQSLLNLLLHPQDFNASTFFTSLSGILTLFAGGTAIIVGSLFSQKIIQGAKLGFTSFLLIVVAIDLIAVFNIVRQTNIMLATIALSPLFVIFIITVLEWWEGKD